jgi:Domain of unknown function (DUF1996)
MGLSDVRIATTGEQGYRDPDGTGAFRTVCGYSHMNFDDAIVFPGQPGVSHLHVYFGNTQVDANTKIGDLPARGNSTCRGGIANRSAYWVPAVIDTRTGAPVKPSAAQVYYKSGYQGLTNAQIKSPPVGLRMIAGDSKNTVVKPAWESHTSFGCEETAGNTPSVIPNCTAGQRLWASVTFPQCWDGVNLDSPDHKSHMAYGTGNGCPVSHPVPIPEISIIAMFPVTDSTASWRLSSDKNGSAAGTSYHGDWMNGWRGQTATEYLPNVFVSRLLNQGLSGGSHMIGDGRALLE